MSGSDLRYFTGQPGFRVAVAFEADDGTYHDFNAPLPAGGLDYWAGLVTAPSVTIKAESGGRIFTAAVSDLSFDNTPWCGADGSYRAGFWDSELPVTIYRDFNGTPTARTFSVWKNRRVILGVYEYGPAGEYQTQTTLATMRIKDVECNGDRATVRLVSLHEAMIARSANTIKNGGEWFRSLPVAALMKRLVQASDPQMSISVDSDVDLGTLGAARCTSWGPCPGMLTDNAPSTYHWIPRVIERDQQNSTVALVGFEVPGSMPRSGGGLASFDVSTGQWTVLFGPDTAEFEEGWPIAIWAASTGSNVYVVQCRERAPNGASKDGFFEIRVLQTNRTGSSIQANGSWVPYWPARWVLRKGVADLGNNLVGYTKPLYGGATSDYYGECVVLPFPQMVDTLADYLEAGIAWDEAFSELNLTAYTQEAQNRDDWHKTDIFDYEPAPSGAGGAYLVSTVGSPTTAGLRYYLADYCHVPAVYTQTNDYILFVSTVVGSDAFRVNRIRLSTGGHETFTVALGGSAPIYDRQVTAWALAPSLSGSSRKLMLAVTKWDETAQNTVPPLSPSEMYEVTFDGASGSAATVTSRWTNTPADAADPADCVSIVHLWTPYSSYGASTVDYMVGVFVNRGNVSGPCYGLGIWKAATNAWIIRFRGANLEKGPTSQRPFAGFVRDASDSDVFRFIDQANGQVWRAEVDLTAEDVAFTIDNAGFPAHTKETHVATAKAEVIDSRTLWGMAPGPHGDVTERYWERAASSASRRQPGLYPLVQLATSVAPCIEVADFGEDKNYTAWSAFQDLMQILVGYRCYPDADGDLVVTRREEPVGTLPALVLTGTDVPDIVNGEYPVYDGARVRKLYDEVVNAVDVTPYAVQSNGEPEPQWIGTAGSTFRGAPLYQVATERAMRVGLTCVSGGDVLAGTDESQQAGVLWRWFRVMETIVSWLTVGTGATDTSIQVAGLTVRNDSEVYAGDQRIRVGDFVQVQGSTQRTIASFGAISASSVTLNLSGTVDVATSAYAEVAITPKESRAVSDGAEGITTTAENMDLFETDINLADASQIRVGMVLQIEDNSGFKVERVLVSGINGNTVTVTRAVFGTVARTCASGSIVKGYVSTRVPGRLYEVGDTGVLFGLTADAEASAADRSVATGDTFILTTKGFGLREMSTAVIRHVDSASIAANQRKERSIKNRFLDPVRAEAVARMYVAELADVRTGVQGLSMPYWPGIQVGDGVQTEEPRLVPPSTAPRALEIRSMSYDLGRWTQSMDLATFTSDAAASGRDAGSGVSGHMAYTEEPGA